MLSTRMTHHWRLNGWLLPVVALEGAVARKNQPADEKGAHLGRPPVLLHPLGEETGGEEGEDGRQNEDPSKPHRGVRMRMEELMNSH